MIPSLLLQEAIAVIRIAIPLILFYNNISKNVLSFWGILASSLVFGTYVGFVHYQQAHNQVKGLLFAPSGEHADLFYKEITHCGLKPESICLRYSYCDDQIACTNFSTILIDPMVWKGIENDSEVQKIKTVIEQHILPTVPEIKKTMHTQINTLLTEDAQKFIFRHELGHIDHNYSNKCIIFLGASGACALASGLIVASITLASLGGLAATIFGMTVGGTLDILLAYAKNVIFTLPHEWLADDFAIQHSSSQEIKAAADFFEQYEVGAQEVREATVLFSRVIPSEILSGHPQGEKRAAYLRDKVRIT